MCSYQDEQGAWLFMFITIPCLDSTMMFLVNENVPIELLLHIEKLKWSYGFQYFAYSMHKHIVFIFVSGLVNVGAPHPIDVFICVIDKDILK